MSRKEETANIPTRPPANPPRDCLIIKNLPYDFQRRAFIDFLREQVSVDDNEVVIPLHKEGQFEGTPRGYCFVHFKTAELAIAALTKLTGKSFGGRLLWLDFSFPREERARVPITQRC